MKEPLQDIQSSVKTRFEEAKRVLSFQDFLDLVNANPITLLRTSPHYVFDAVHHFGLEEREIHGKTLRHAKLFDLDFVKHAQPVAGQEIVQDRLLQILTGFARSGRANKIVILHGPNGSAKSTLVRALFEGLERYSRAPEGLLFAFSWIFPQDAYEKSSLGIGSRGHAHDDDTRDSYARLDQTKIGAIVRSELHENPIFLIPKEDRARLFEEWHKAASPEGKKRLESMQQSFMAGELSHKNALIFNTLLDNYNGDFQKVLRHVRVERFYLAKRMRRGLVTVEPQLAVDATLRQVTLDRSMANLPPVLQSLNLFQLEGDLVDGNRGVVEYDDMLKRPMEHFKYLLSTSETGAVNMGPVVAFLDTIFIATTNDRQLEAFREHPEFNSFKARTEFIKVPYLLRYSEEERIYTTTAKAAAGNKELVPHTTAVLALWAVLTRLKPPVTKGKSAVLARVLERMTPLQKANLYDHGELPEKLNDDERRELRSHIDQLSQDHEGNPYYEGLFGASARELKVLLQLAAQNDPFPTLGPNAVFSELEKLVERKRDFEYLRQDSVGGYFDFKGFIEVVRQRWLDIVDREVRQVLDIQQDSQLADFLSRYITQLIPIVRGEKVRNRITGRMEDVDSSLLTEFEKAVAVTGPVDDFRKNLISRLGAWSVEHKGRVVSTDLPYAEIFPDLVEKLQEGIYEKQAEKLRAVGSFVLDVQAFDTALDAGQQGTSEAAELALKAYQGLQKRFGYGQEGAKEVLSELMRRRYSK